MVVFTCCHCGESLKKSKVEKHYEFSCRNFPALTCVDCLKDFNGNAYIAHTTCVTEEERYSAKGFVSKPPSNKGKDKQESWFQFIQTTLDSNVKIDEPVKKVLELIAGFNNVPKKESKFLNFCKSTCGNKFPPKVFESVWMFLEEKQQEHQNKSLDDSKNEVGSVSQEDRKRKRVDSLNVSGLDDTKLVNEESGSSDKKKKKRKREKHDKNSDELKDNEHIINSNLKEESKKEKKTKFIQNGNDEDGEEIISKNGQNGEVISAERTSENCQGIEVVHLSKKEKKERRKREKYEKQLLEIQNVPVPNEDEDQMENNLEITEKSKKKKKNKQENIVDKTEYSVEDKSTVQKGKKHQNLDNEIIETQEPEGEQEEKASGVKTSARFNWEETIVKLLESKGELPLKRVEKKVVNEFINSGVHVESIEKAIAKFNKKILKISRVKVKKDVVKLVS